MEVLKQDLFGSVRLTHDASGRKIIERDLQSARYGCRWLARLLARREVRALRVLDGLPGVPRLLQATRDRVCREYLTGQPMQKSGPTHPDYYRQAARLVRALHRRGVAHNDLAKEPNWLVSPNGAPALVDFQLASVSRTRSRWFRSLAHDDLRHLLKHKRHYLPQRLTAREQRILSHRSWLSRAWMAGGKPVYLFVTRRLLKWRDREGAGDRELR